MKKIIVFLFCLQSVCLNAQVNSIGENQPIKPALVIIDIQNEFIPRMSDQEKKYAFDVINGSIWFFRKNNLPIIRVYHSDINWGPEEGTEAFEYPKSIIIRDTDLKVLKHYPSAFIQTDLDTILKENGCNTIYICGLSATGCVLATYFGGVERGYKTFLIRDGVMSHNPGYTNVINDICDSMNFESMMYFLQNLDRNYRSLH